MASHLIPNPPTIPNPPNNLPQKKVRFWRTLFAIRIRRLRRIRPEKFSGYLITCFEGFPFGVTTMTIVPGVGRVTT